MEEYSRKVLAKRYCLVQFMVLISFNFLILEKTFVLCLDTKYFKRFYFGNLSVDLTEELGERFNYDYLPSSQSQSVPLRNSVQSNAYHSHVKQSSGGQHPHREHVSYDGSSSSNGASQAQPHHVHNHQGDQPVNGSNGNGPKTTAPPPSNNQPYKHQDLKALSRNITNILNSFNVSYDKRVRPNYGGEAVEVGITMFVLSISDLSEVEMDFTLDFYFRQMWKDHRLTFQGPKGVNTLSVSSEFLKSMWVPDTFFVNEKTSYFHTATTNNEFLRISQTGDILRSMRLTVCASCPMDLRHFPMDSQLCTIEIESFGYTMSDIRYKWNAGPGSVGMANDVSLPQFKVYGYRQKTYEISLSTGNYSRLACEIQFVRAMGYYLIQIYIPSSLIVVISWVSFWLNRNAAPARVYLGITTVLTMTTLMSSTNKALPKISYVKSIDVYLGTCFVMVFAALLEYATVGYLAKRIQMRKNHFAALQKMALQLQNARDEHVQKQYAPAAPTQQQAPVALPPPPTTPHHHHASHPPQQAPTTPHTPRYTADHYQSSSRFVDSSSLRKQYTTNNAQFSVAQQQQSHLGSTVSIPYYSAQGQPQPPQPQQSRQVYDSRYYDAQYNPNTVGSQAVYYQQGERAYYQREDRGGWGEGGTTSRGASVKRRAAQPQGDDHMYMQQQVPPSLLQNPGVIVPHQVPVYHHHQAGASGSVMGAVGSIQGQQQQQQVIVGSVIGTTSSIEQPQPAAVVPAQTQQQTQQQSASGDKIRQLIPINPNQICGITPSDIDKYSRVVFPVCFVCFNLLYWIIYLHISNVNPTADLVIVNQEG